MTLSTNFPDRNSHPDYPRYVKAVKGAKAAKVATADIEADQVACGAVDRNSAGNLEVPVDRFAECAARLEARIAPPAPEAEIKAFEPPGLRPSLAECALLIKNGYEPIVLVGKRPAAEAWQSGTIDRARFAAMRETYPQATNTGLRTGKLVAIDIDVHDPAHIRQIVSLAETVFGYTPLQRFGAKGLLLCYRNDNPIRKVTIVTDTEAKVEILGSGQQFAAFGIHPDTGKPFEWRGTDFEDTALTPLNTSLDMLPEATFATITEFARQCAELMSELGYANPRVREAHSTEKKTRASNVAEDSDVNIERATEHLKNCVAQGKIAIINQCGSDTIYELAALLMDKYYLSEAKTTELMLQDWYPHCKPNDLVDECVEIISHAARYMQNEPGANATGPASEAFKEVLANMLEAESAPLADGYQSSGGLSFRSMQDIAPLEIDWLWPERIAAGKLTLIAGAPDGGKSQIAANIAATISNGGAWPFGEGKAEQGAVIWLSAEDDPADTTVPRLIAAGANRRLIFELKPVVRVDGGMRTLNVVEDLNEIATVIDKIKADYGVPVRAIVIDPISAYMGGRAQGDSWKNSDVRHTMTPLLEFVARVGISTLGITHFKKGKDADVLNRVIDSIALPALSRATWLVAPEKDDEGNPTGRRLFLIGKKNIGRPVSGLAYKIIEKRIDNGRGGTMPAPCVEWAGYVAATADDALAEQAGKAGKLEAAEDFLQLILADGPISEKEIRKRAGDKHRWRTLQRAKEKLGIVSERAGGLAGSGEWQWILSGAKPAEDDNDPDAAFIGQPSRQAKSTSRPL